MLDRAGARERRDETAFGDLLRLLDGYPLALEVVLPNLATQSAQEVHDALQQGLAEIDQPADGDVFEAKTRSLIACIDYSHGHLDPAQQTLLLCFAPFTGVINTGFLAQYIEQLKAQPALAGLPLDDLAAALTEAEARGLLSADADNPAFRRPQPAFGYFLANRLTDPALAETRAAIEAAFVAHMTDYAGAIYQAQGSKQPEERKLGLFLAGVEYANLHRALILALAQGRSILECYRTLSAYIDAQQDHERGLELGEAVLAALERGADDAPSLQQLNERIGVIDNIANRYLQLRHFNEAKTAYQQALALASYPELPATGRASILQQLGLVAQEQRQFDEAAGYYRQSLKLRFRHGGREHAAGAFHQLGIVAEKQRRLGRAGRCLRKSLQLKLEHDDRRGSASTLHQLGRVADEQDRLVEAARYYHQALNISLEYDDRPGAAITLQELGNMALDQGRLDDAEGYFRQALEILLACRDRHCAAMIYHQLGIVMARGRRHAESLDYYLNALPILAEAGDGGHSASIVLHNLAHLWRAWGDDVVVARTAEVMGQPLGDVRALFEQVPPDAPEP